MCLPVQQISAPRRPLKTDYPLLDDIRHDGKIMIRNITDLDHMFILRKIGKKFVQVIGQGGEPFLIEYDVLFPGKSAR